MTQAAQRSHNFHVQKLAIILTKNEILYVTSKEPLFSNKT